MWVQLAGERVAGRWWMNGDPISELLQNPLSCPSSDAGCLLRNSSISVALPLVPVLSPDRYDGYVGT